MKMKNTSLESTCLIRILVSSFTSCRILRKLVNLSIPQFHKPMKLTSRISNDDDDDKNGNNGEMMIIDDDDDDDINKSPNCKFILLLTLILAGGLGSNIH